MLADLGGCWYKCSEKGGPCPHYCHDGGYCCRYSMPGGCEKDQRSDVATSKDGHNCVVEKSTGIFVSP